jgi:uncharacterized repeat protein (TIGR03943 family)
MKSLSTGKFRGLVLTAWTLGLALLLGFGRYSLFIRSTLWPLVLCNILILSLFLIAMLLRPVHGAARPVSLTAWVRGGMLLLPLLYMGSLVFGSAASGLNSFALQKRSLGLGAASDFNSIPDSSDTSAVNTNAPISLGEVAWHMHRLAGTRVITEGRVSVDDSLPPGQIVIFRFVIICCAADAMPVEVVVQSPKTSALKPDDWIRVSGILKTEQKDGNTVPVIMADQIDPIPTPDDPYLSPLRF